MKVKKTLAAAGLATALTFGTAAPVLAVDNSTVDSAVDQARDTVDRNTNDRTGLWGLLGLLGLAGLAGLRRRPATVVDRTTAYRDTGTGSTSTR